MRMSFHAMQKNVQPNNIYFIKYISRVKTIFFGFSHGKKYIWFSIPTFIYWGKCILLLSGFFPAASVLVTSSTTRESIGYLPGFFFLFFCYHDHPRVSIFPSRATLLPVYSTRELCITYICALVVPYLNLHSAHAIPWFPRRHFL